jgi:hypothetical protein
MTSSENGAFLREATGLTRQISGWDAFLGNILVQYLAYSTVPPTIVAAFVIYGISYTIRKRQGIALGAAFKEIPPE